MERACRPLCGLRVGAASEDENRLLQRCEPAWRLVVATVSTFDLIEASERVVALAYSSKLTSVPSASFPCHCHPGSCSARRLGFTRAPFRPARSGARLIER